MDLNISRFFSSFLFNQTFLCDSAPSASGHFEIRGPPSLIPCPYKDISKDTHPRNRNANNKHTLQCSVLFFSTYVFIVYPEVDGHIIDRVV